MSILDSTRPPAEEPKVEEPKKEARPQSRNIKPARQRRAIKMAPKKIKPPKIPLRERLPRPDREKVRYAYWNVTGTISLIVNAILIAALIILSRMLFQMGQMVNQKILFEGFYMNFGKMDAAHIKATIKVNQEIPISLPIHQPTIVTLTEDTLIEGARVTLTTGGLNIINAPTNIILPAGSRLPIQLDLTVQSNMPVSLTVPVDIPLKQTELHEPFYNLQRTFEPFISLLYQKSDWEKLGFCKILHGLCDWWFYP